jgi:hypothetical protein
MQKQPASISYDRYTDFLSKRIHGTISSAELEDVHRFEATPPKTCPKCHATVQSQFLPGQIVHDIEKCSGTPAAKS